MKTKRLNPTDSTAIKFNKLCELANDLGITIHFSPIQVTLTDNDRPNIQFYIKELDEPTYSHTASVNELPPMTETRIIYNIED